MTRSASAERRLFTIFRRSGRSLGGRKRGGVEKAEWTANSAKDSYTWEVLEDGQLCFLLPQHSDSKGHSVREGMG